MLTIPCRFRSRVTVSAFLSYLLVIRHAFLLAHLRGRGCNQASAIAFNQNSNAVAVGLGRAGSHEIGHYLLQQNFDSPAIQGVMHHGFSGAQWFSNATQGLWTFSARQIMAMNKLCATISTPTMLPNNSLSLRPLLGGGVGEGADGGSGGGVGYPSWWYAMLAFLAWINSIQVEKVTVVVKDGEEE